MPRSCSTPSVTGHALLRAFSKDLLSLPPRSFGVRQLAAAFPPRACSRRCGASRGSADRMSGSAVLLAPHGQADPQKRVRTTNRTEQTGNVYENKA
jgi:hypothetical protein